MVGDVTRGDCGCGGTLCNVVGRMGCVRGWTWAKLAIRRVVRHVVKSAGGVSSSGGSVPKAETSQRAPGRVRMI